MIPTDIPRRINKSMDNPISKSVIYTPTEQQFEYYSDGDILVRFAYSKNTFWTNFKYLSINGSLASISLVIITSDKHLYTLYDDSDEEFIEDKWYNTRWPIPSIKFSDNVTGVYLKCRYQTDTHIALNNTLRISMLGFIDLFPDVNIYHLLSERDISLLVFNKKDVINNKGTIYKTIDRYYNHMDNENEYGIRLLSRY